MKKNKVIILTLVIFILTISLPFFLSFLLHNEWLQFISGPIDSWIGFWGSYIGAIIGSVAVFIVAKHQIKKQHEQQVDEINAESNELFQRRMEGYMQRKRIEKLDVMLPLTTKIHAMINYQINLMFEYLGGNIEKVTGTSIWTEEELDERLADSREEMLAFLDEFKPIYSNLQTVATYIPETIEQMDQLGLLYNEFQSDITLLLNGPKGYISHFSTLEEDQLHISIKVADPLNEQLLALLELQQDLLRYELQAIEQITGIQFTFTPQTEYEKS